MSNLRRHVVHSIPAMSGSIKCLVQEEMLFQEFQDGCHGHHFAMVSKF